MRTRDMRCDQPRGSLNGNTPRNGVEHLPFSLHVSSRGGRRVVRIGGELDMVTRSRVRQACLGGSDKVVEVEMSDITFMDCCGYGALVAARSELHERGGSLTLHNENGQPAHLLRTLTELQEGS